jgi:drug/metabolite transporter (DMT)-like permease
VVHLLALIGVVGISFSAIFVRLAAVSPVTAAFFRTAYAVPVLAAVYAAVSRRDSRSRREHALAFASGLILAVDLSLWHETIALVGAGLATVIASSQVIFVALLAWALCGERPTRGAVVLVAIVLAGVALTSGLARPGAYGARPVLGAFVGTLAGLSYAAFLLAFRASNRSLAPSAGPLLDSTLGTVAGAIVLAPLDPHFAIVPVWPAHGWLLALALVSQVVGWLLIANALPRLPAIETSVLLLGQPALTVIWGLVIFDERLSPLQWAGATIVLLGVGAANGIRAIRQEPTSQGT